VSETIPCKACGLYYMHRMECVENYGAMDRLDSGMTHRLFKLEQENKMMRECIEFVIANSGTSTNYNLKCRETLNKLTKDEK
jgi:hypothetical protein